MPEWMKMTNALGPEKIVHVYDPETGMKGVLIVPDFVSNAGGTVLGILDFLGGTSRHAFDACKELIGSNTRTILADARKEGVDPRRLATRRVEDKVAAARRGQESVAIGDAINRMKERLGL